MVDVPVSPDGTFSAQYMTALYAAIEAAQVDLRTRLGQRISATLDAGWAKAVADSDDLIISVGDTVTNMPVGVSTDQLLIAQNVGADLIGGVSADLTLQRCRS
jgi:hypothetical protein